MANEKLIVELSAQIQGLKSGLDNASKEIGKFNTKPFIKCPFYFSIYERFEIH